MIKLILIMAFLFAAPVMSDTANTKPSAEEFLDADSNTGNEKVDKIMDKLFGAEVAEAHRRNKEEREREDREQERRWVERDLRLRERDLQLREDEYKQERLRHERESQERAKARFDQGLRDVYRPATKTDCYTDFMGSISCTTH